jgi:hypothetical protein
MSFRIRGLAPQSFEHLYGRPDRELAARGVQRVVADCNPGYPDRITLRDANPGQPLLLLNYAHQPADNAYRSSHAIFVLEGATQAYDQTDRVPPALLIRPISLRAFNGTHDMIDALLAPGSELAGHIEQLLQNPQVAYLHAHYATRGCFAARVDRVADRDG